MFVSRNLVFALMASTPQSIISEAHDMAMGDSGEFGLSRKEEKVSGTNGTVGRCKSCVSKEFGFEDGTGLLHERVVVAAAFEDAGFAAAVAVADFAVGDLLE